MHKSESVPIVGKLDRYPGVDFQTLGTHVVAAGSIHPETGSLYAWNPLDNDLENAPAAPAELLDIISRQSNVIGVASVGGEYSAEEVAQMLRALDPEEFRDHDDWLKITMSCHHASGGDARAEFIEWSASDPEYADRADEIGRRWDSLGTRRSDAAAVTHRTLLKALMDRGLQEHIPRVAPEDDFDDEPPEILPESSPEFPEIRIREGGLVEAVEATSKAALFAAYPARYFRGTASLSDRLALRHVRRRAA